MAFELKRPDGVTLAFDQEQVVVGRSRQSDVMVDEGTVSRIHALIFRDEVGYCIETVGTATEVRVNDSVTRRSRLVKGDRITVGSQTFVFLTEFAVSSDAAATSTGDSQRTYVGAGLSDRGATHVGIAAPDRGSTHVGLPVPDRGATEVGRAAAQRGSPATVPGPVPELSSITQPGADTTDSQLGALTPSTSIMPAREQATSREPLPAFVPPQGPRAEPTVPAHAQSPSVVPRESIMSLPRVPTLEPMPSPVRPAAARASAPSLSAVSPRAPAPVPSPAAARAQPPVLAAAPQPPAPALSPPMLAPPAVGPRPSVPPDARPPTTSISAAVQPVPVVRASAQPMSPVPAPADTAESTNPNAGVPAEIVNAPTNVRAAPVLPPEAAEVGNKTRVVDVSTLAPSAPAQAPANLTRVVDINALGPVDTGLSAVDKMRLKKKASGRATLWWQSLSPKARRGLAVGGVTLGLVAVLALAVTGPKQKKQRDEPDSLSSRPTQGVFGLGEGVTFTTPDEKAFTFEVESPVTTMIALHFECAGLSEHEVAVNVNGAPAGWLPADGKVTEDREHILYVPAGLLKRNQQNRLVFDNINNPPGENAWRVSHVWVELIVLPMLEEPALIVEANTKLTRGFEMWKLREIAPANTWAAYKNFREAWLHLEALPEMSRPTGQYETARHKMIEAQNALDDMCMGLLMQARSAMSYNRVDDADSALNHIAELFPSSEHPCQRRAIEERAELGLEL